MIFSFANCAKRSGERVLVQGGTFIMGSNDGEGDEKPPHKVYVDDFYISKTEITNAQFCEFLNVKGNQTEGGVTWLEIESEYCKITKESGRYIPTRGFDNHPVVMVSWYGARAYSQWAGGQLPTEAQWEYAARGGNKSNDYTYSGSNNIEAVAWYEGNSGGRTHPVATKQPNELGIYDMTGNVWEWCADWYDGNYYNSNPPYENPKGPATGSNRVLRGGSWYYDAQDCRSARRGRNDPDSRNGRIGFRLVFVP
jgi:formylglycine-generating enzyme required for sulfatase activity